nr:hypothetical protein [Candidatus Njordarchaeota archaeon]
MPVEKGEKRRETEADSHEEDREGEYLERWLSEYKRTMNHPTTSNEATLEKIKPEENRVDDETRKQPTDSQPEKPSTEENTPQQKDRQDSHQGGTTAAEHPQKPEERHQQNSQEANQHREAPPTERPNLDHSKEADSSARQAADHQEEKHSPLRLSENPQAFVEGNRELLVKQGIIPEKDEARLDDKTTAKFDVNEGLTIIHKDQSYKITTVEQERIGDLQLRRYKTE